MPNLSRIYNVDENLRGIAKDGYCRPTLAEQWDSEIEYEFGWCSLSPIQANDGSTLTDNDGNTITIEGI